MTASIDQVLAAKNDMGLQQRAIAAGELLGIKAAAQRVPSVWGLIVAAEVPEAEGGTTSIAYALDYHLANAKHAVAEMNDARAGLPAITATYEGIGASPFGVSDAIITAAVKQILQPEPKPAPDGGYGASYEAMV